MARMDQDPPDSKPSPTDKFNVLRTPVLPVNAQSTNPGCVPDPVAHVLTGPDGHGRASERPSSSTFMHARTHSAAPPTPPSLHTRQTSRPPVCLLHLSAYDGNTNCHLPIITVPSLFARQDYSLGLHLLGLGPSFVEPFPLCRCCIPGQHPDDHLSS